MEKAIINTVGDYDNQVILKIIFSAYVGGVLTSPNSTRRVVQTIAPTGGENHHNKRKDPKY